MKPIGGYFGLELPQGTLPHPDAIPVNFGRGGLELILRVRKYHRVWIPNYICPCVPQFLNRFDVSYSTYKINDLLEPINIPRLNKDDAFLYVNYFGIKNDYCRQLEKYQPNLILDLTQAFYYIPRNADGFNSARKFFGVPDGGFVYLNPASGKIDELSRINLPVSNSYSSCAALLHRADGDLAGGYAAFHESEAILGSQSLAAMSQLTRRMLSACDIEHVRQQRIQNFRHLAEALHPMNRFRIELDDTTAPLIYPYLVSNGESLKKHLIDNQIFCPTYWPNIESVNPFISEFISNLVCIPLDQRYSCDDMKRIVEVIKNDN